MYHASQLRSEILSSNLAAIMGRPSGLILYLKGEKSELEEKARKAKLAAIKAVYGE